MSQAEEGSSDSSGQSCRNSCRIHKSCRPQCFQGHHPSFRTVYLLPWFQPPDICQSISILCSVFLLCSIYKCKTEQDCTFRNGKPIFHKKSCCWTVSIICIYFIRLRLALTEECVNVPSNVMKRDGINDGKSGKSFIIPDSLLVVYKIRDAISAVRWFDILQIQEYIIGRTNGHQSVF